MIYDFENIYIHMYIYIYALGRTNDVWWGNSGVCLLCLTRDDGMISRAFSFWIWKFFFLGLREIWRWSVRKKFEESGESKYKELCYYLVGRKKNPFLFEGLHGEAEKKNFGFQICVFCGWK